MGIEKSSGIKTPSLTREAKKFNAIALDSTVQGMKTAALMDRTVREAEKVQEEAEQNPVQEEKTVPTGEEIRQDLEKGEYR